MFHLESLFHNRIGLEGFGHQTDGSDDCSNLGRYLSCLEAKGWADGPCL